MSPHVYHFDTLPVELRPQAGGKGAALCRMFQAGYPVPAGFVILPAAFERGVLARPALAAVAQHLAQLAQRQPDAAFAVRSSALHEDSTQASFAGEFETVLNVRTQDAVLAAITKVVASTKTERAHAYSAAHHLAAEQQMAVVVQIMVPAEVAGVVFTADPLTGSHLAMVGNYVHGLGEQLVAGEANAQSFKLLRPGGKYQGPAELKKYAPQLQRLAARLEKEFGSPQDIEWAIARGQLFLLQSRPITTLQPIDYDTYWVNDSVNGDYLWTNTNVGEAMPGVLTPLTWSFLRELDKAVNPFPGYYLFTGNIHGRVYSNISMLLSVLHYLGFNRERGKKMLNEVFGPFPPEVEIPLYPFHRWALYKTMLQQIVTGLPRVLRARQKLAPVLAHNRAWCEAMYQRLAATYTLSDLRTMWLTEIRPYVFQMWEIFAGAAGNSPLATLRAELSQLVGAADASQLLSNFRAEEGLESLGVVVGLMQVAKGELSRADYLARYGHRSAHELEFSIPAPLQDPNYLDKQLAEHQKHGVDVAALLQRQQAQYLQAHARFGQRHPRKRTWLTKKLATAQKAAQHREKIRSEIVRSLHVVRVFMQRAGVLTGLGDKFFFLYAAEMPALLAGEQTMLQHLAARQQNFEYYKTLPPFPRLIRGRFDPAAWAKQTERPLDYYAPNLQPLAHAPTAQDLQGFPGAAGQVTGMVRVLTSLDEAATFVPGEILVATTTNIGWTPLFPKAAAIITDIGAPLSHAAIVARELGIPAVVGCGNATTRLRTGNRVLVDGGQGIVQILE